jgi:hypothetical protein
MIIVSTKDLGNHKKFLLIQGYKHMLALLGN